MRFGGKHRFLDRFWMKFERFLFSFGRPWASQNGTKIDKKNDLLKRLIFKSDFKSNFVDLLSLWPLKMDPKSFIFCYIFENVDFVKIVILPGENQHFTGSEPPNIDPKSIQNAFKLWLRKRGFKITDFYQF